MKREKSRVSGAPKPRQKSIKSTKKPATHAITETHPLYDGDLQVYRNMKGGNVWQYAFWIREENKMFRRSAKTRNLDEAKRIAKDSFQRISYEVKLGNKIFVRTAQELVNDYIAHKQNEANAGIITQERISTIKTGLTRWYLRYVGPTKRLSDLNRNDFQDYFVWVYKNAPTVREVTLTNYQALISALYKWGINNGYLKFEQVPLVNPHFRVQSLSYSLAVEAA